MSGPRLGEKVSFAELREYVELVAEFYERHGRDATAEETAALVMDARVLAAAKAAGTGGIDAMLNPESRLQ